MITLTKKRKGNRGSALLIVAYLGIVLFGVVGIYFYRSSQSASTESQVRENVEGARNAAEYAAELAIANLSDMKYTNDTDGYRQSVLQDWVMRNPYTSSGIASAERHIRGNTGPHNEYDYRVVVRAVREAKEYGNAHPSEAMPKGWLSQVNPEGYSFGNDPIRKFTGAYEVIASARRAGESLPPTLLADSSVRTVVNMNYNSAYNDLENLAVLHVNDPGTLNVGPKIPLFDLENWWKGGTGKADGTGSGEMTNGLAYGENQIWVSGEDHYAVRAVRDTEDTETIEGLASLPKLPSQLYSVVNTVWDAGKMTLHFQNGTNPNPNIPRTPTFSTSVIDRTMIALRPEDTKDEYVFGGKGLTQTSANYYSKPVESGSNIIYGYGRSVTLLEDGMIKETNGSQATPSLYAESALAVGYVENMLRFYLNFVETNYPANTASAAAVNNWKNTGWRQLPLGYHTKAKTKNANLREYRRPLDNRLSDARRRWGILLWIKDRNGRFLVRDHTDWRTSSNRNTSAESGDNMAASYPYPMSTWNGRYRWAMYGGYGSNSNADGGHYHIGNFSATNQYASTKQTIHTRILTLEELIGYQFYTDSTGVPAKVAGYDASDPTSIPPTNRVLPDAQIVAGVPDYYLAGGKKVPYEPYPGTQFDEAAQRVNRSDNYGRLTSGNYAYPLDGLYVYDDVTKETTNYKTLKDFAFKLDISEDPAKVDEREVVTLHMVFENTPEVNSSSPNMYFDMGLTVTIVYPKTIKYEADEDFLKDVFRQWWDGSSEESLTGEKAHYAVSSIPSGIVMGEADDVAKIKSFYQSFGFYDEDNPARVIDSIDTAVNRANEKAEFPRAIFADDGTLIIPSKDQGTRTFYYGRDDLYFIYSLQEPKYYESVFRSEFSDEALELLEQNPEEYYIALLKWREDKALEDMRQYNNGYEFKRLPRRFEENEYIDMPLSEETTDALLIPPKDITARYMATQLFGFENIKVPAAYAKWNIDQTGVIRLRYSDLDHNASPSEIPPFQETVHFLPGEMVPDSGNSYEPLIENSIPAYISMKAKKEVFKQHNGRDIKPTFIWETTSNSDELDMSTVSDWPKWFLGTDPEESDINSKDLSNVLDDIYSWDRRSAMGWHREGPTPKVPSEATRNEKFNGISEEDYKLIFGDNYEFVVISRKGFNPYYDLSSGAQKYLASALPKEDGTYTTEDCKPALKAPRDMPTFTFDGEVIDGAGILVVNGNLDIQTTFAYHGVLVVLGDINVTPKEKMLYNENGKPYDSDKNEIFQLNPGGQWYYYNEQGVQLPSSGPETEWMGKLVVQGQVLVGGTIRTHIAREQVSNGQEKEHYAQVDIRGSWQSVKDVLELWSKVAPNEGFVTDRLGWTGGTGYDSNLWNE